MTKYTFQFKRKKCLFLLPTLVIGAKEMGRF